MASFSARLTPLLNPFARYRFVPPVDVRVAETPKYPAPKAQSAIFPVPTVIDPEETEVDCALVFVAAEHDETPV